LSRHDNLPTDITRRGFATLNSVVRPAVKAGIGNPLPIGAGAVVLETTGRRSGLPRQVPVLATRRRHAHVSTVRSDSQWLRNIEADPTSPSGSAVNAERRRPRSRAARSTPCASSSPDDR
jgi:hypothetical protein